MADNIVATPMADCNVKQLNDSFKTFINGLSKPNQNSFKTDGLTTANYILSQNQNNTEIVSMFNYLVGEINQLKEENVAIKKDHHSTKTQLNKVTQDYTDLRKVVLNACLSQERHQQFQNRDTFKLCGVTETTTPGQWEDTADTVVKALNAADIPLTKEEISASYRVPTGKDGSHTGPKNIMVKCNLHNTKDRVMRNKKTMRTHENFKRAFPNAFIVEQLTPLRSKVAYMLRNDASVEKSWTINGRIKVTFVGSDSNTKPKSIDSLSQLKQVMQWSDDKIEKLVFEHYQ